MGLWWLTVGHQLAQVAVQGVAVSSAAAQLELQQTDTPNCLQWAVHEGVRLGWDCSERRHTATDTCSVCVHMYTAKLHHTYHCQEHLRQLRHEQPLQPYTCQAPAKPNNKPENQVKVSTRVCWSNACAP